jgi:hypothetical protein
LASDELRGWLAAVRRYLLAAAVGHLAWEIAQLPLFTLWYSASSGKLVGAVLHCWIGDLAISAATLLLALAGSGTADWPLRRGVIVAGIVVALSVGYTTYSEYLNTVVRQSWAYSPAMPTLLGVGLSPLAQWVIVPVAALAWARRSA